MYYISIQIREHIDKIKNKNIQIRRYITLHKLPAVFLHKNKKIHSIKMIPENNV